MAMYYMFGSRAALETLVALSQPHARHAKIRDVADFKEAYAAFLKTYQPGVPRPASTGPVFVTEADTIERLAGFFRVKSWLNDRNQGKVIEGRFDDVLDRIRVLEAGLDALAGVDGDFVELFRLAINFVFCASSRLAGGGTTSSALGVIWAAHRDNWSRNDVFEFFVHELAHNLVFLDECRFRHYPDYPALALPENYARSAILSMQRPLDKVVHSLVVAAEVLRFRERVIGHPDAPALHPTTEVLLAKASQSYRSVAAHPRLVELTSARVRELIERAGEIIEALALKQGVTHDAREQAHGFQSVPLAI
jgi:hypothetical protein